MNQERLQKKSIKYTAYANMLPIIQSSGTGKSRMVDELAKCAFTIPFNLQGKLESQSELVKSLAIRPI